MTDRKRRPSYVAKTIRFEDQGQDFLEWDLSADDVVIGCRTFQSSFQSWVWEGCRVINPGVEVGERVIYIAPGSSTERVIAYPVEAVD